MPHWIFTLIWSSYMWLLIQQPQWYISTHIGPCFPMDEIFQGSPYRQRKIPSLHTHVVHALGPLLPSGLGTRLSLAHTVLSRPTGSLLTLKHSLLPPSSRAFCLFVLLVWDALLKNIHTALLPHFLNHCSNIKLWEWFSLATLNKKATQLPYWCYLTFTHHICHRLTYCVHTYSFVCCLSPSVRWKLQELRILCVLFFHCLSLGTWVAHKIQWAINTY